MTCTACEAPGSPVTLRKGRRAAYHVVLCPACLTDATVNLGYERTDR